MQNLYTKKLHDWSSDNKLVESDNLGSTIMPEELSSPGILQKAACGRWWHGISERHYSVKMSHNQHFASSKSSNSGQVSNFLTFLVSKSGFFCFMKN